jgi:hypothetical protein
VSDSLGMFAVLVEVRLGPLWDFEFDASWLLLLRLWVQVKNT